MAPTPPDTSRAPIERFRPTNGRVLGWTGIVLTVGLLLYIAVDVRTITGLRIALALAFFGVLVWATQLRPRAALFPEHVQLQNSFRDFTVPLALVDDVTVRRTLNVWVGAERYVCIGIGQSLRSIIKTKSTGPSVLLGFDKLESYRESATPLLPDQSAMDYGTFVATRITGQVDEVRRSSTGTTEARPRHHWARWEIVVLALTASALLVSLLL